MDDGVAAPEGQVTAQVLLDQVVPAGQAVHGGALVRADDGPVAGLARLGHAADRVLRGEAGAADAVELDGEVLGRLGRDAGDDADGGAGLLVDGEEDLVVRGDGVGGHAELVPGLEVQLEGLLEEVVVGGQDEELECGLQAGALGQPLLVLLGGNSGVTVDRGTVAGGGDLDEGDLGQLGHGGLLDGGSCTKGTRMTYTAYPGEKEKMIIYISAIITFFFSPKLAKVWRFCTEHATFLDEKPCM